MPSSPRKKRLRFHESTQRALCRMVFLLLALTPVVGVAGYSVLRITPWYQSYQKDLWQRRLSDNLGVNVHFKTIEFRSPNQFRATDLIFANPETGQQILTVETIEVSIDRGGWLVHNVVSPVLNGSQVQLVMDSLHDRFLCRPQSSACLLGLSMPELLISNRTNNIRIQNVKVGFTPTESMSQLLLLFSLDGRESSNRASLSVDRDHIAESTKWTFKSNNSEIPCHVLSARFPPLRHLGSQASFRGTISCWQNKQNSQISIQGNVHSVDLAAATLPIGSPIQGLGELRNLTAIISGEGLRQSQGTLISPSCNVDSDWLDRMIASNLLYTDSSSRFSKMGPNIPPNYLTRAKNVAVQFTLEEQGLRLSGNSDPNFATLVGYVDGVAVGCRKDSVIPIPSVLNALSMYLKPNLEFQPSRIADGRR